MSLIHEYPQKGEVPGNSQDGTVKVKIPADAPTGKLVGQLTLNLNQDRTAFLASHQNAGDYLVILSTTVVGNPPQSDALPALLVSYSYDGANGSAPYTVLGAMSQGTDVVNGFTVTQSVRFAHNGQGVIAAGTVGGQYTGEWTYSGTVSIYRL